MRALATAATGMYAQQLNLEVISNNIANMNTVGFKRQRAEFQDLLYQNHARMGADAGNGLVVPSGIQIGAGVKAGSVQRVTEQGNMQNTGNPLDLALNRQNGYFQVTLPSGETAYTRAGNFDRDPSGQLVTEDGYVVQPGITIPENALSITVTKEGIVQVTIDGQTGTTTVGQLEVAMFANQAGLDPIGDNLFLESGSSGAPTTGTPGSTGFPTLLQGFLESSNVDPVREISRMIFAQRAYEMGSKTISTADDMMQTASNLKR